MKFYNNKYDIFISYRRQGGYDTAKHLNDLLVRDGYKVCFDIDTLRSGDFDEQLLKNIDKCKDFILIVDPHAFDRSLDVNFDRKTDWLRNELSYALKKRKNIIPIFLSGIKSFPEGLPDDIKEVSTKNGPEYNRYYFNDFYTMLKKRFLKSHSKKALKYSLLILVIIACIIIGFSIFGGNNPIQKSTSIVNNDSITANNVDISFYTKESNDLFPHELFANVDGYEYAVEIPKGLCIEVIAQEDFDGDGIKDALIENIQACGGNSVGNSFFFAKYDGTGYFSITNEFGKNVWEDPKIEKWKNKLSVVIIDTNEGANTDNDLEIRERYVLNQGKAVRVETAKKNTLTCIKEIKASDFHNGKEGQTISMDYDLDGNGQMDRIDCSYWDRWDALMFNITVNGKTKEYSIGYSRIGISNKKTNGVNDLICGADDIAKWNGSEYVCKSF